MWAARAIDRISVDPTPLRRLTVGGTEIVLKDESALPTGSTKHRTVAAMFRHAIASGRVTEGSDVIVATAGAVAVAAAYFAARLGLRCTALVPAKADPGVLKRTEQAGGRWQHAEGPPAALQQEARALAERWGGHFLDQFTDAEPAVAAWPPTIADELFGQLPEPPRWIVVGAGTGATSAAIGRHIRKQGLPTKLALVDPENSAYFPAWGDRCARLRHRHAVTHPGHRPPPRRTRVPTGRGGPGDPGPRRGIGRGTPLTAPPRCRRGPVDRHEPLGHPPPDHADGPGGTAGHSDQRRRRVLPGHIPEPGLAARQRAGSRTVRVTYNLMVAIDDFDRYPLLFGPSPVHRLDRLTAHLGGADVWAKREDCNSGIAFGGNKTRKLEYLVADALAQGCDTLVSIGGVQSNHTRQVAAVAARVGMKCVLVQESWVDWPDAVYDKVGNILLSRLAGADVRLVKAGFGIGFKESWQQALSEIEASGGRPYAIPAGASDHRLGGLGFANWAYEVATQERELGVFFDTVVVCSVTGSTQAGMIAGFAALGGRPRRVLGIDASAKPKETWAQVARIARNTASLIGLDRTVADEEILLDERYHAGIYGIPDESTMAAMRLAARTEGMITDPVYEGKSMAGLIDLVTRGEIPKDSTVLYAHLGGQPALNGYSALFS